MFLTYAVVENFVIVLMFQIQRINFKRIYHVVVVLEPEYKSFIHFHSFISVKYEGTNTSGPMTLTLHSVAHIK